MIIHLLLRGIYFVDRSVQVTLDVFNVIIKKESQTEM